MPVGDIVMEQATIDALRLDDYLFRRYRDGTQVAMLYIGYYSKATKLGAAHDPLVCFLGQGWEISPQRVGVYRFPGDPEMEVNYSVMVASRGEHRELVLYWYQSMEMTASNSARQKLNTICERLKGKPGRNALVRISVPVGREGSSSALQTALKFLESFYPSLREYISS